MNNIKNYFDLYQKMLQANEELKRDDLGKEFSAKLRNQTRISNQMKKIQNNFTNEELETYKAIQASFNAYANSIN